MFPYMSYGMNAMLALDPATPEQSKCGHKSMGSNVLTPSKLVKMYGESK